MAPKISAASVIDGPPSAASSSKNENEHLEEDQEQTQDLRADNDEEDDEESESDDAAEPPQVVKPKPTAVPPKPKIVAKPKKRPAEPEKEVKKKKKKSKKSKKTDEEEEESVGKESEKKSGDGDVVVVADKPQLFQRLWSEEDEIVILKGMIESIKKGNDPLVDQTVFLNSIKKLLHVDGATCKQLLNKMRRLKKKYFNNLKRAKGGKDPSFSNPHELKSYELSKEIWGGCGDASANGNESKMSSGVRTRKKLALSEISAMEMPKVEERRLGMYPYLNDSVQPKESMNLVGGSLMREGLALLAKPKVEELKERWRKLQAAELKVYLERVELFKDHAMAVLNALESSDSSDHE